LALNYASTLGVFANEGVELYTPWFWSPSYWEVVHLFSHYNKNISIKSTSSDENNLSAYSTTNANNDSLTVVFVNRYTNEKTVKVTLSNINIPNGTYQLLTLNNLPANNSTETFNSHSSNALKSTTVAVLDGTFTLILPALSISSAILTQSGTTGISKLDKEENFFYPNPAKSILYLNIKTDHVSISIFDINGKMVVNKLIEDNQVDISNLQNGIYTIKIGNKTGSIINKFIKQ